MVRILAHVQDYVMVEPRASLDSARCPCIWPFSFGSQTFVNPPQPLEDPAIANRIAQKDK